LCDQMADTTVVFRVKDFGLPLYIF
jgi:hypothetical protein